MRQVMQFYAISYLKIIPSFSRNILGLGHTEYHTGNYIYALWEKEKYHKTHKPKKRREAKQKERTNRTEKGIQI
jgi:hypothetical protein